MNLTQISTQLLFSTVPIWVDHGSTSQGFGTGFIFSVPVHGSQTALVPLLVTCRHVLVGGRKAVVEFVGKKNDQPDRESRVRATIESDMLLKHSDEAADLVLIPLGAAFTLLEQTGRPVYFRSVTPDLVPSQQTINDLAALEDITFIGYPSGIFDSHNATPIIRRGITATPVWNDFEGKPAFLVDAGAFPGSSGSPVFILNEGSYVTSGGVAVGSRLLFLGVLSGTMLREEPTKSTTYLGLGRVTKARLLVEFAERVAQGLLRQNVTPNSV